MRNSLTKGKVKVIVTNKVFSRCDRHTFLGRWRVTMTWVWIDYLNCPPHLFELPLDWNPAQRGFLEFVGLFGAEVAMFIDTASEEILHQSRLDALLLGKQ